MYIVKVKINGEWSQIFEGATYKVCETWWNENEEDYIHHPHFEMQCIKLVEYKFFKAVYDNFEKMYKVIKNGMETNKDSTTHIIQEMQLVDGEWVENNNGTTKMLVFSPLKGFKLEITNEDIWEVMGLAKASKAERAKRQKEFNEHRAYFDKPNDADYCTWHEPKDRVGMNHRWVALTTLN